MTQEMQTALHRLKSLPEEVQANLAPRLNKYLNKLDDLRAAIQEGIDSGSAGALDMDEIIQEARTAWEAENRL